MPKPPGGTLDDESVHLKQTALYVEPINYPLDENHFPTNGHEYIHLVQKERAALLSPDTAMEDFVYFLPETNQITKSDSKFDLKKWKISEAKFFGDLAIELKSRKAQLIKKFPKKTFPSVRDEKACCLFCLGSEMYKKIFTDEEVEHVVSNGPFLSLVLYLSQEDILILLKHLNKWSTIVGMNHEICEWIFGLLACIQKPINDKMDDFLEDFYDSCVEKIVHCKENEKKQLHLISAIINSYFCIKSYEIGPPLSSFKRLH